MFGNITLYANCDLHLCYLACHIPFPGSLESGLKEWVGGKPERKEIPKQSESLKIVIEVPTLVAQYINTVLKSQRDMKIPNTVLDIKPMLHKYLNEWIEQTPEQKEQLDEKRK